MKKSILLASLVAAVALAACGKKPEDTAPVAAPAPAASEAASAPAMDASAPAMDASAPAAAASDAASK